MRLAAIDIGSNGARLLIKNFRTTEDGTQQISRVMYMRVPLRLGSDVFTLGKISKERMLMMKHMLKAFKQIMKLNQVDDYRACATSAMRDAENGKKVLNKLRKSTGIDIEIINGREEARLLCNNIVENIGSAKGNYAYIDVGGGSTEISLLHDGALTHSQSYNIGTLRMLGGMVSKETVEKMKADLKRFAKDMPDIRIIGSGGNINKLFKLTHAKRENRYVTVDEIKDLYSKLKVLSVEERIEQYGLKVDRADVIIPAAEIFITAAEALGCDSVQVPNISLADSIVDGFYRDKYSACDIKPEQSYADEAGDDED
ncbi:Ppx/GppA phosphatase family protein [Xylanibacter rarus]|uniref:Ppx/GppA phosphatase family protein n=1 Tax=Xylanibacter rarus TaxID=1676614 RepID=UPI003FEE4595